MSRSRRGQTWWITKEYDESPCCEAPSIATNGEDAVCQTCGWEGDLNEVVEA